MVSGICELFLQYYFTCSSALLSVGATSLERVAIFAQGLLGLSLGKFSTPSVPTVASNCFTLRSALLFIGATKHCRRWMRLSHKGCRGCHWVRCMVLLLWSFSPLLLHFFFCVSVCRCFDTGVTDWLRFSHMGSGVVMGYVVSSC